MIIMAIFRRDPGVPCMAKINSSHNKRGVFARRYANEEIPTTSKLFIVMVQCTIE